MRFFRRTADREMVAPGHKRPRWWLGIAIGVLGMIALGGAWWWHSPDRTMQMFAVYEIVPAVALLLLIWWTFLSRLPWKSRAIGLIGLATAFGLFTILFRLEGFSGEMIPIFVFRWRPRPQDRAVEYQASHAQTQTVHRVLREVPVATPDDWPTFRGPGGNGVVAGQRVKGDWKQNPPKLVWKHPVGAGWGSFSIVGERCFTLEQRGKSEAVVCYELETGHELWAHLEEGHYVHEPGGEGPRSTPIWDRGYLYSVGANGLLTCLDAATGELEWKRDTLKDHSATVPDWGVSYAPLLFANSVVVNPGGKSGHGLAAYHPVAGELLWHAGDDKAGYSTPQLVRVDGTPQILLFDAAGLAGHDPGTGEQLWKIAWTNGPGISAAQPICIDDRHVFFGSGYGKGSGLAEIKHSEKGWSTRLVWETKELKLKFNGAAYYQGFIYGLDEGVLVCLDAKTGKRRWKQGRYKYGQMLRIDDQLLIQSEDGYVALVRASPDKCQEVMRFDALEGTTWNQPAIAHGRLLVRNAQEAACFAIELEPMP